MGFFVAVMQIMMGQLRLFAELARIEHDSIRYEMEQQRKHCREQLEEQLLKSLEADRLVCCDENGNPIPRKKRRASRFRWEQARLAILLRRFYSFSCIVHPKSSTALIKNGPSSWRPADTEQDTSCSGCSCRCHIVCAILVHQYVIDVSLYSAWILYINSK
jgi:hypothetical protein